ncbi:MAG TPA: helix-turn-helix domain-containing protein [Solirubrobacterales bacterium]|nr:helix-turn-helix domain-containing protein [Solirubrobacterales bacterium]
MSRASFDVVAFYAALDAQRQAHNLTWKKVASEAKVSASTLTRMGQGKRPDVDSLAALCAWSGLDADNYIRSEKNQSGQAEPLAMISTYLRSDSHLSPESADALDAVIKATYERFKDS